MLVLVPCFITCFSTGIPEECKPDNYKHLDEDWRYHSRISSNKIHANVHDNDLPAGWYRFTNSSYRMIEKGELYQGKTFDKVCMNRSFDVFSR